MSSRTNLKLALQREQAQRDDDVRKGASSSSLNSDGLLSGQQLPSSPLRGSPLPQRTFSPNSNPISLSSTAPSGMSDFQQQYSMNGHSPTQRFFTEDKPKQHLGRTFFPSSMGRASPLASKSIPTQLSLTNLRSFNNNASPLTPDSPMTPHSIGTPHSPAITDVSELDELVEDITEMDQRSNTPQSRGGRKDKFKSTSPIGMSLAANGEYMRMLDPISGKLVPSMSSSCPATVLSPPSETEESIKSVSKDRQKKDNHNIIERKRRDNINNLIKELRTMLPHSSDPNGKQMSKGSTLKGTVDYLKELKKDREKLKIMEEREKAIQRENRKLVMKVQEMERLMEAHGLQAPMGMNDGSLSSVASIAPHLSALITGRGSPQQDSYPGTPTHLQQHNQHSFPPQQPMGHTQPQQNQQYIQIKQEPAPSPIPQHFQQYGGGIQDDYLNYGVADLVSMMDTTEIDPMVTAIPFDGGYNSMSSNGNLEMDFLS